MVLNTTKKEKRITTWILILSITGLVLVSILPVISVVEDSSTKDELYFNNLMMKRSDNERIKSLSNDLDFISILFWVTIAFTLVSLIGLYIHLTSIDKPVGKIMAYIGCANVVSSVLIIRFILTFIKKIDQINNVSPASAFPLFEYSYIPLIFALLILVCSTIYTLTIVIFELKKLKIFNKGKKQIDKKIAADKTHKPIEKNFTSEKIALDFKAEKKRVDTQTWANAKETQKIGLQEEPEIKPIELPFKEKKEIIRDIEPDEELKPKEIEDEIKAEPFPTEKPREKTKDTGEVSTSIQFEKALSTAIEKKQTKMKQQDAPKIDTENTKEKIEETLLKPTVKIEKMQIEQTETKKKINVRCPQCKFTFPAEKQGNVTNIKCPQCGKEGVIK